MCRKKYALELILGFLYLLKLWLPKLNMFTFFLEKANYTVKSICMCSVENSKNLLKAIYMCSESPLTLVFHEAKFLFSKFQKNWISASLAPAKSINAIKRLRMRELNLNFSCVRKCLTVSKIMAVRRLSKSGGDVRVFPQCIVTQFMLLIFRRVSFIVLPALVVFTTRCILI